MPPVPSPTAARARSMLASSLTSQSTKSFDPTDSASFETEPSSRSPW